MFKLLILLPLIVFIDPFVLYCIWPHLHHWAQIVLLIVFPILATFFLRRKRSPEGEIVSRVIRTGLRFAVWYPGIILKTISFLLLWAPVEKRLAQFIVARFQKHILRGINIPSHVNAPPAEAPLSSPEKTASLGSDDDLKPARGRVIE